MLCVKKRLKARKAVRARTWRRQETRARDKRLHSMAIPAEEKRRLVRMTISYISMGSLLPKDCQERIFPSFRV